MEGECESEGERGDIEIMCSEEDENVQFICVDMTRAAVLHRSLKWAGYKQVNCI